jgi:hypothetical protein
LAATVARGGVVGLGSVDDAMPDPYAGNFVLRSCAVRSGVMNESCGEIAATNG